MSPAGHSAFDLQIWTEPIGHIVASHVVAPVPARQQMSPPEQLAALEQARTVPPSGQVPGSTHERIAPPTPPPKVVQHSCGGMQLSIAPQAIAPESPEVVLESLPPSPDPLLLPEPLELLEPPLSEPLSEPPLLELLLAPELLLLELPLELAPLELAPLELLPPPELLLLELPPLEPAPLELLPPPELLLLDVLPPPLLELLLLPPLPLPLDAPPLELLLLVAPLPPSSPFDVELSELPQAPAAAPIPSETEKTKSKRPCFMTRTLQKRRSSASGRSGSSKGTEVAVRAPPRREGFRWDVLAHFSSSEADDDDAGSGAGGAFAPARSLSRHFQKGSSYSGPVTRGVTSGG